MQQEKRDLIGLIASLKKEVVQTQKQAKAIRDNNRQMEDGIVKLSQLVHQKADRNHHQAKDVALVKRDVRNLYSDCEELKQEKGRLQLKIEGEYRLIDVVQRLVVNLKKQNYEVRREKEKLQITVRGEQRKAIDVIAKRRCLITEESEKIYLDFKDTMNHNNAAQQ